MNHLILYVFLKYFLFQLKMTFIYLKVKPLEIYLTNDIKMKLSAFFVNNPHITQIEHYLHTRNPLDNLSHYMWEELMEPTHINILNAYNDRKKFDTSMFEQWLREEADQQDNEYIEQY